MPGKKGQNRIDKAIFSFNTTVSAARFFARRSGDSAYEYFLKYYLYNPRGGATDERLKHMYRKSVETMKGRLVKKSANGLTYLTDSGSSRGSGGKMEVRVHEKRKCMVAAR